MARENLEITLAPRSVLGKKLGQLRRDGFVPAHMYGQNAEALTLQGERLEIGLSLIHISEPTRPY